MILYLPQADNRSSWYRQLDEKLLKELQWQATQKQEINSTKGARKDLDLGSDQVDMIDLNFVQV